MSETPFVMPGVTAHLTIGDGKAADAIDFYKAAFGATEQTRHLADDGARIMHAHLVINDGPLMLNDHFHEMAGGEPAPPPASAVAIIRPMPVAPPVTRAILPSTENRRSSIGMVIGGPSRSLAATPVRRRRDAKSFVPQLTSYSRVCPVATG